MAAILSPPQRVKLEYCGRTSYTPHPTKLKQGILVSPWPSVCLSICGQNCACSVSSTILARSISYLHALSSNFRCVAFKLFFKIKKIEVSNSLNLWLWLVLTWDPKWTDELFNSMGNHGGWGGSGGGGGCEARVLVFLVQYHGTWCSGSYLDHLNDENWKKM